MSDEDFKTIGDELFTLMRAEGVSNEKKRRQLEMVLREVFQEGQKSAKEP